jgi:hypothetical protein
MHVLTTCPGPVTNKANKVVAVISTNHAIMELRIGSNRRVKRLEMDAPGTLPHNIKRIATPFSLAVNCNWSVKYVIATVASARVPASELSNKKRQTTK